MECQILVVETVPISVSCTRIWSSHPLGDSRWLHLSCYCSRLLPSFFCVDMASNDEEVEPITNWYHIRYTECFLRNPQQLLVGGSNSQEFCLFLDLFLRGLIVHCIFLLQKDVVTVHFVCCSGEAVNLLTARAWLHKVVCKILNCFSPKTCLNFLCWSRWFKTMCSIIWDALN